MGLRVTEGRFCFSSWRGHYLPSKTAGLLWMLSAPCPPELGCIVVLLCPYVLLHSDSYIWRKFVSSFVVIAITKHQRLLLHKIRGLFTLQFWKFKIV